jgi:hypothetical protein
MKICKLWTKKFYNNSPKGLNYKTLRNPKMNKWTDFEIS